MSALIFMLKAARSASPGKSSKRTGRGKRPAASVAGARRGKRVENKARTKERILEAALRLFRKHGLEGTTTKQISRRAGVAEGTLFNYFRTKEDLALFFFQKGTTDLIAWFHGNVEVQRAPLHEK